MLIQMEINLRVNVDGLLLEFNILVLQWGLVTPKQETNYPITLKTFVTAPICSWAYAAGSARGVETVSYDKSSFTVRESNNGQVTKENSIQWFNIGF